MDSYSDDIDQNILQFVSTTILKGYLKYGRTKLAESFMEFINPKLSMNQNWLLSGKLAYYVCAGETEKINELKNEFRQLNEANGWDEINSEVEFYTYLCLRYLEASNHLKLMQSIDKLVQLNKKLDKMKNRSIQHWRWTNLFTGSRQKSFFAGPHNYDSVYEFRFNLYKRLLDSKLTLKGFALVHNDERYDETCCAPTVLLDLCLEALMISVEKYQEAYNLSLGLIIRSNYAQKLTSSEIERYLSLAFDAYIRTQNQQSNVPEDFSAYQRLQAENVRQTGSINYKRESAKK